MEPTRNPTVKDEDPTSEPTTATQSFKPTSTPSQAPTAPTEAPTAQPTPTAMNTPTSSFLNPYTVTLIPTSEPTNSDVISISAADRNSRGKFF